MIKENKKNKFITCLCACLMAVGSLFGLVGAVGDTLAYTPSLIDNTTMQDYIINYKNYDYNNIFDGYFEFGGYNTLTANSLNIKFYDFNGSVLQLSTGNVTVDNNNLRFYGLNSSNSIYTVIPSASSYNINLYIGYIAFSNTSNIVDVISKNIVCISALFNNGNIYNVISKPQLNLYNAYKQGLSDGDNYDTAYSDGQNSVLNNPNNFNLYTQQQYEQNYNLGVTQGQNNVLNNPNAFGLYTQAQYQQNYNDGYNAGVIHGQNNVINNPNDFNLNTNQQLQDSYNQGFEDGEQSSSAYQNGLNDGIIQGQNEVINNPNDYNLYTQVQYQQNYNDGYADGIEFSQYGVFFNAVVDYSIHLEDNTVVNLNNVNYSYLYSGIQMLDTSIPSNVYDNMDYIDITVTFDKPFLYTIGQSEINYAIGEYSILSLGGYYLYDVDGKSYLATYSDSYIDNGFSIPITPSNVVVNDTTINGKLISKITFYCPRPRDLLTNVAFVSINSQYQLGYADGYNKGSLDVNSDIYYNGYADGNKVGYQTGLSEGLNNQNRYTFVGLLTAVVQAPVNVIKDLFNFELMGFNMLNFFLGCLTAVLILWLIRKVMGGK